MLLPECCLTLFDSWRPQFQTRGERIGSTGGGVIPAPRGSFEGQSSKAELAAEMNRVTTTLLTKYLALHCMRDINICIFMYTRSRDE